MKLVLLSGGSGKRLWPLSNHTRPKQFLKILGHRDGEPESMVQRLWRQLAATGMADGVYVSTCQAQADILQSQLGEGVSLIIEPEPRDTYPAIALAAVYLHSTGAKRNEVLTFMPVDPYVEAPFFERVKALEQVIRQAKVELALVGVRPTYPSTKYGYIVPAAHSHPGEGESTDTLGYRLVQSFVEKPDADAARQMLAQQALWNCGVFACTLGYLLEQLEKRGVPTDYQALLRNYTALPKTSFDYEIVENVARIAVLPYVGEWKDIGTWNTLTEQMEQNLLGKGVLSRHCSNTHVINDLDIPVVAIDVDNVVVAASPEGILVADKAASHQIKDLLKDFEQRPMYEERRWGWYRVLDYKQQAGGEEVLTKRLCLFAGKNISYQYHHHRREVWVIVAGNGEFVLNGQLSIVGAGDVLEIPAGASHGIKAISDVEIIEVQMGSKLVEDDIVRLYHSWEELKQAIGLK